MVKMNWFKLLFWEIIPEFKIIYLNPSFITMFLTDYQRQWKKRNLAGNTARRPQT